MRENAIIRLRYRTSLLHLHVGGVMRLERLMMPFHYTVPLEKRDFDHQAKLDDIESRGLAWETKLQELAVLRGWKGELHGVDVKVTDVTMYPESPDHWKVVCVFIVAGKTERIELSYQHPGHALSSDALRAKIDSVAATHGTRLEHVKAHMEGLSVLDNLAKATVTRIPG